MSSRGASRLTLQKDVLPLGWHLLISFEVCISETASSIVKPCQALVQLSSVEPSFHNWITIEKLQPGVCGRTNQLLLVGFYVSLMMSQAQQIEWCGIWWCFDFHCRNFMEFVWSKKFPPSSASLGTPIPPESLGWFTKGLATWHYCTRAQWGGGTNLLGDGWSGRGYQAIVLSMACLQYIGYMFITYIYLLLVGRSSWHRSRIWTQVLAIIGGSGAGKTTLLDTALSSAFRNKNDPGLRPIKSGVSEDVPSMLSMMSMSILNIFEPLFGKCFCSLL